MSSIYSYIVYITWICTPLTHYGHISQPPVQNLNMCISYLGSPFFEATYFKCWFMCVLFSVTFCKSLTFKFQRERFVYDDANFTSVQTDSIAVCFSQCHALCKFVRFSKDNGCQLFKDAVVLGQYGYLSYPKNVHCFRKVWKNINILSTSSSYWFKLI